MCDMGQQAPGQQQGAGCSIRSMRSAQVHQMHTPSGPAASSGQRPAPAPPPTAPPTAASEAGLCRCSPFLGSLPSSSTALRSLLPRSASASTARRRLTTPLSCFCGAAAVQGQAGSAGCVRTKHPGHAGGGHREGEMRVCSDFVGGCLEVCASDDVVWMHGCVWIDGACGLCGLLSCVR
jgi:hypothetical protein